MDIEKKYEMHLNNSVTELFKTAQKINKNTKIKLNVDDMGTINAIMMDVISNFIVNLIGQLYHNQSDAVIHYNLDVFYKKLTEKLKGSISHYRKQG